MNQKIITFSIAIAFTLSQALCAANFTWRNTGDLNFNNPSNWGAGIQVPGAKDIAILKINQSAVLSETASVGQLRIGQNAAAGEVATVELALGSELKVSSAHIGYSLGSDNYRGTPSAGVGLLTVNGSLLAGNIFIGNAGQKTSTNDATGTIEVNSGGTISTEQITYIGAKTAGNSAASDGTLIINKGAVYKAAGSLIVGHGSNCSGTLTLNGGSAILGNGLTLTNKGSAYSGHSATLNLLSGKLEVSSGWLLFQPNTQKNITVDKGVLIFKGDRKGNLKKLLQDSGTKLSLTGGMNLEQEAVISEGYRGIVEITQGNFTLKYGYNPKSDMTALWTVQN